MAKKSFIFPDSEINDNFSSRISTHVDWEPRTNIIEVGDVVIIEVELPGVSKEDVSITLEDDNILIIRGVRRQPRLDESERVTYHMFEREFGSFYKRIVIDFPLDSSRINSVMENGVLTVKIPRKKAERISVEIK
ncbi:MAG: Hsp20/alpha crystallin family protein [Candidatus Aminicenantes bacterium]|nr:MAG: Hsp20/alpha crystallin family protein [Candidatus Aminicenantes bacterium]